uniref:Uncharacterized protein n=1 Tax=Oryza nivara TaxID=4536 RepID=A0A0E0I9J4_ORYNI
MSYCHHAITVMIISRLKRSTGHKSLRNSPAACLDPCTLDVTCTSNYSLNKSMVIQVLYRDGSCRTERGANEPHAIVHALLCLWLCRPLYQVPIKPCVWIY